MSYKEYKVIKRLTVLVSFAYYLVFCGCLYNVPITDKPMRKIDERLLGDWIGKSEEDGETVKMKVAKLDDYNYVVYFDHDLYRAYHSDVENTPLLSVQDLDTKEQKYSYSSWEMRADGTLIGRTVNDKIVPDETKDSATVQQLLKKNLTNPKLFGKPMKFTRETQNLGG